MSAIGYSAPATPAIMNEPHNPFHQPSTPGGASSWQIPPSAPPQFHHAGPPAVPASMCPPHAPPIPCPPCPSAPANATIVPPIPLPGGDASARADPFANAENEPSVAASEPPPEEPPQQEVQVVNDPKAGAKAKGKAKAKPKAKARAPSPSQRSPPAKRGKK